MIVFEYVYLYVFVKNGDVIVKGEKDKLELGIKVVSDIELEIILEKVILYFDYLLVFLLFFL